MKAKVVKLSVYEHEEIMLIAPTEIMDNFLSYLGMICYDAADHLELEGCKITAEQYKVLARQIHEQLLYEE